MKNYYQDANSKRSVYAELGLNLGVKFVEWEKPT